MIVHACARCVCVYLSVCWCVGGGLFGHLVPRLPLLQLDWASDTKRMSSAGCCWPGRGGERSSTEYPPGGLCLGWAGLRPLPARFQLRLEHQCDRWLVRGWHQPSSQHWEIVSPTFWTAAVLWYEIGSEDEQKGSVLLTLMEREVLSLRI